MTNEIDRLNRLPPTAAISVFERCCSSEAWAVRMEEARPFADRPALLDMADRVWWALGEDDWRQAFAAHPRIGDVDALVRRFDSATWASGEQKGALSASREVLEALAAENAEYEQRFGFIFIICATGKSADEMLVSLQDRIGNDPETEMGVAAEQQRQITRLRLAKLLEEQHTE